MLECMGLSRVEHMEQARSWAILEWEGVELNHCRHSYNSTRGYCTKLQCMALYIPHSIMARVVLLHSIWSTWCSYISWLYLILLNSIWSTWRLYISMVLLDSTELYCTLSHSTNLWLDWLDSTKALLNVTPPFYAILQPIGSVHLVIPVSNINLSLLRDIVSWLTDVLGLLD